MDWAKDGAWLKDGGAELDCGRFMAAGGGRPRWGVDMGSSVLSFLVSGRCGGYDGPIDMRAGEKRDVDGGVGGE